MPTTLELLEAERAAQAAEEARPPICDVECARALIMREKPAPNVCVSLEMCLLRMEGYEKFWRLELIDRADEFQFNKVLELYQSLDFSRRSKFVFQLTIWKNHNDALNHLEYRQGFSYRFAKVHSLRLLYGNPVGSMQIRQRLRAEPLTATQLNPEQPHITAQLDHQQEYLVPPQGTRVSIGQHHPDEYASDSGAHGLSAKPPQVNPDEATATPPQTPSVGGDGSTETTPAAKTSTKRKTAVQGNGSPSKKQRKNAKALCFESPSKPTRS